MPDSTRDNPGSVGDVLGDALIPVINKLQDIFSQVSVDLELNLPQVAVIGSQSSGKSSVLEALVGRDFLPRGSDIVTRRPLLLQLIKTTPENGKPQEWGEFLHAPGKIFTDFERIRTEIQQETDRLVGGSKNVSPTPIRLKIFSPRVLTMTLVDLPGLTKVPVGDQPSNIEQRIREMVLEHIKPANTIILAVSPANSDLATSDALQMAQFVDPEGVRTIGVLTKLDIMDRGTDASHILKNQHIPLRLGYVAVVNRSQADINSSKSMHEARKAEETFFDAHPEYRSVSKRCGIAHLARYVNSILVEHIRRELPGLRRKVAEALERRQGELKQLGSAQHLDSKSSKSAYLLQMLCSFAEHVSAILDGRHLQLDLTGLAGGARIRHVFTEVFAKGIRDISPMRNITDEEILTVIRNGGGVSGSLLVPQEPFELLVRQSIVTLLPPALQCKDLVYEELVRIADCARPADAARFPVLQRQLMSAVMEFIRSGAEPAERMIRDLVECELDYINTDHPDFLGGRGAIRAVMQERAIRQAASSKEAPEPAAPAAAGKKGSAGAENGRAGSNSPAMGLKVLPDSTPATPQDVLLKPTRRHSDDSEVGTSSGSWFSWFSRPPNEVPRADSINSMDDSRFFSAHRSRSQLTGHRSPFQQAGGRPVMRSEQDEVEVEIIRRLVDSYFNIVRRNIADQAPKAIMHFMVNHLRRGLQQHLICTLYKEDSVDMLLTENEEVVLRRAACREALAALQAASQALDELPTELSHIAPGPLGPGAGAPLAGQGEAGALLALNAARELKLDRHPSMTHAARTALMAAASLGGGGHSGALSAPAALTSNGPALEFA